MINLIKGDCLEKMKSLPDGSIDMILCDLPYGVTDCKWDTIIPFEPLWEQYNRIIKDKGAIVLFADLRFANVLINSNTKAYKYKWYWNKQRSTGHLNSKKQPMRCIEEILVFTKGGVQSNYYPETIKLDKPRINNPVSSKIYNKSNKICNTYYSYPNHYLEFKAINSPKKLHSSEKPVDLLEYLIKTYTLEGETVLDNCMGSGSTGVACINTKRKFIGIELDEDYYNIAKKRIEECLK